MGWTASNVVIIVIGLFVIIGCIMLIKNREAVFKAIVEQNTKLYGKKWGDRLGRTSPAWGVLVPAVGGLAIGTIFILAGIFGQPR